MVVRNEEKITWSNLVELKITLKKPHNEPYSNRIFNPVRNGNMAQKTKCEIPFTDELKDLDNLLQIS